MTRWISRLGVRRVIVGVALALAAAQSGCSLERSGDATAEAEQRRLAPDFTIPDLDGNPVSLSQFRGKTVVVDFWATWCPPCIFQVPELNAFWEAHKDRGDVAVLGVAVDVEGVEVVAPWVAEQSVRYTILLGSERLANEFGVLGFPTLAVVAPDGTIDSLHVGLIERDELEEVVAAQLPAS
ncbi:MAG: TlpA disulfide reductase family protein [Myxococcota bacterium]